MKTLFTGLAELLTMDGHGEGEAALGLLRDAALLVGDDGLVAWLGPQAACSSAVLETARIVDLDGATVLPGLVDPHTHLVFGGDRAADFVARCRGETYASIAARGGGILTTVRATREASPEALAELARARLDALLAEGVTTVEVKTGYGLSVEAELKQLAVIEAVALERAQRVVPTLLLHMVPAEFREDRGAWVSLARERLIPAAAGRARFADVFVERNAFTPEEGEALLAEAARHGLGLKAHTEQLSATGFGLTAARMGAVSLEHLEHATPEVLDAMAEAGTVAVLLPGASVFLGDHERPPVGAMRARGIRMALGTDLNPGTSPLTNPWLVATLACTQYGLLPAEALLGLTRHAAAAVGLDGVAGLLAVGRQADFIVTRGPWERLLYGLGHHPVAAVHVAGVAQPTRSLDASFR